MREQYGSYNMIEPVFGVLASIKLVLSLLDHVNAQGLNQWLLNISGECSGVLFVYQLTFFIFLKKFYSFFIESNFRILDVDMKMLFGACSN